jgi:hypothetical protein
MKKFLLLFPLLLIVLTGAGCTNTAEENGSISMNDNSTRQAIEKLKNEEDKAMNFNILPFNGNSSATPLSVEEPNKNGSTLEGTLSTQ